MKTIKSLFFFVFLIFVLSACRKNAACPSVTLCPAPNPIYFAVNGSDTAFLSFPNAFTPNGDGLNDEFRVFEQNINALTCYIYNGNNVVYQTGTAIQWDGLISGHQYTNVYTVKMTGKTSWGASFTLTGTLSDVNGSLLGESIGAITTNTFLDVANARFESQYDGYNGFNPAIHSGENIITDSVIVCH